MHKTKREFQNAFRIAKEMASQGLSVVKYVGNESTEHQLIKPGTAICYAAKRFVEDPGNLKIMKDIENWVADKGVDLGLVDKDTKALLWEANGMHQFTQENRKKYRKEVDAYLEEKIDMNDIKKFICKKENLPDPVPFELECLNGLILHHGFWEKVEFDEQNAAE